MDYYSHVKNTYIYIFSYQYDIYFKCKIQQCTFPYVRVSSITERAVETCHTALW